MGSPCPCPGPGRTHPAGAGPGPWHLPPVGPAAPVSTPAHVPSPAMAWFAVHKGTAHSPAFSHAGHALSPAPDRDGVPTSSVRPVWCPLLDPPLLARSTRPVSRFPRPRGWCPHRERVRRCAGAMSRLGPCDVRSSPTCAITQSNGLVCTPILRSRSLVLHVPNAPTSVCVGRSVARAMPALHSSFSTQRQRSPTDTTDALTRSRGWPAARLVSPGCSAQGWSSCLSHAPFCPKT
jgi:hypothetical protein